MTKKQRTMTCKLCGAEGYNSRKCPTKTHPWTALTMDEVSSITSLLGIDNTQLSQQQIDHAITQRTTDVEPLAVYYHANLDKLPNVDTSSPEGQIAQALDESTKTEVSHSPVIIDSQDLETIKGEFDSELWYQCCNNLDRAEQLSPEGKIGNSYFEHWTSDETGLLSILVRAKINGYDVEYISDWDHTPNGIQIAQAVVEKYLGETPQEQFVAPIPEPVRPEPQKPIYIDNTKATKAIKATKATKSSAADLTLVGYEPTQSGYKVLYFGDQGYQQGEKELGFQFSAQLGWSDVEKVIENMSGNMRLVKIPIDQVEILTFMRPGIIPFEQWLEIDIPRSSVTPDDDVDPIVLSAKQDPVGRIWIVQAVCVEV